MIIDDAISDAILELKIMFVSVNCYVRTLVTAHTIY